MKVGRRGLKVLEIHVVPIWEDPDGWRRPGMEFEDPAPRTVGWGNVLVVEINGARHELLGAFLEDD